MRIPDDWDAQVILYNDDVNTFEHVVRVLQIVFGHSRSLAMRLAFEAHRHGKTIAELESKRKAVRHAGHLVIFGLNVEVETV